MFYVGPRDPGICCHIKCEAAAVLQCCRTVPGLLQRCRQTCIQCLTVFDYGLCTIHRKGFKGSLLTKSLFGVQARDNLFNCLFSKDP